MHCSTCHTNVMLLLPSFDASQPKCIAQGDRCSVGKGETPCCECHVCDEVGTNTYKCQKEAVCVVKELGLKGLETIGGLAKEEIKKIAKEKIGGKMWDLKDKIFGK